jgi:hypothetical protein
MVAKASSVMQTPVQDAMYAQLQEDRWSGESETEAADDNRTQDGTVRRKSVMRAAMYSALLPGAGEYYVGNRTKAKVFFAGELLIWAGFVSFRTYSDWKKDDYIRFARLNAGASLEGKSDDFLGWVGFYESIDQYNDLGRAVEPGRPYLPDTPENHWRWQSDADREHYQELKRISRRADQRADFMIGAAIVNRIISIIDSVRDAVRLNRRAGSEFSELDKPRLKVDIDPFRSGKQVKVTLLTSF